MNPNFPLSPPVDDPIEEAPAPTHAESFFVVSDNASSHNPNMLEVQVPPAADPQPSSSDLHADDTQNSSSADLRPSGAKQSRWRRVQQQMVVGSSSSDSHLYYSFSASVDVAKESQALAKSLQKLVPKLQTSTDQEFFTTMQAVAASITKYPSVKRIPHFSDICQCCAERVSRKDQRLPEVNAVISFLEMLVDTRGASLGQIFSNEYGPWIILVVSSALTNHVSPASTPRSPATPMGNSSGPVTDAILRRYMNVLKYFVENPDGTWHLRYLVPALVIVSASTMNTLVRMELQSFVAKLDLNAQVPSMAAALAIEGADEKRISMRFFKNLFEKHADPGQSNVVPVVLNFTGLFAFLARSVEYLWSDVLQFLVTFIQPEAITEKHSIVQCAHFLMDFVKKLKRDLQASNSNANNTSNSVASSGRDELMSPQKALTILLKFTSDFCAHHRDAFCTELIEMVRTSCLVHAAADSFSSHSVSLEATLQLYATLASDSACAALIVDATYAKVADVLMSIPSIPEIIKDEVTQILTVAQQQFAALFYSTHLTLLKSHRSDSSEFLSSVRGIEFACKWLPVYRVFPCDLLEAALRMPDAEGVSKFFDLFITHLFVDDVAQRIAANNDFAEYIAEAISVLSVFLRDRMVQKEEIPAKSRISLCTTLRRLYGLTRPKYRPAWVPLVAQWVSRHEPVLGYDERLQKAAFHLIAAAAPLMAREYLEPFLDYAFSQLQEEDMGASAASVISVCGFYFPAKVKASVMSQLYSEQVSSRLAMISQLDVLWMHRFSMAEAYARTLREGPLPGKGTTADAIEEVKPADPSSTNFLLKLGFPLSAVGIMREPNQQNRTSVLMHQMDYVPATAFTKGQVSLERIALISNDPNSSMFASPSHHASSPSVSTPGSNGANGAGAKNADGSHASGAVSDHDPHPSSLAAALSDDDDGDQADAAAMAARSAADSNRRSGSVFGAASQASTLFRMVGRMKKATHHLRTTAADRRAANALTARTDLPPIFTMFTYAVMDLLEDENDAVFTAARDLVVCYLSQDPGLALQHMFSSLAEVDPSISPASAVATAASVLERLSRSLHKLPQPLPPNLSYVVFNFVFSFLQHAAKFDPETFAAMAGPAYIVMADVVSTVEGLPLLDLAPRLFPGPPSACALERAFFAHRALRAHQSSIAEADLATAIEKAYGLQFCVVDVVSKDGSTVPQVSWLMYLRRLTVLLPETFSNLGPYVEAAMRFVDPVTHPGAVDLAVLRLVLAFLCDAASKYAHLFMESDLFRLVVPSLCRLYETHWSKPRSNGGAGDAVIASSIRFTCGALFSLHVEDGFLMQAVAALGSTLRPLVETSEPEDHSSSDASSQQSDDRKNEREDKRLDVNGSVSAQTVMDLVATCLAQPQAAPVYADDGSQQQQQQDSVVLADFGLDLLDIRGTGVYSPTMPLQSYSFEAFLTFLSRYIASSADGSSSNSTSSPSMMAGRRRASDVAVLLALLVPYALEMMSSRSTNGVAWADDKSESSLPTAANGVPLSAEQQQQFEYEKQQEEYILQESMALVEFSSATLAAVVQQCLAVQPAELCLAHLCATATSMIISCHETLFAECASAFAPVVEHYVLLAAHYDLPRVPSLFALIEQGFLQLTADETLSVAFSSVGRSIAQLLSVAGDAAAAATSLSWSALPSYLALVSRVLKTRPSLCTDFVVQVGDSMVAVLLMPALPPRVRRELWTLCAFVMRGSSTSLFSSSTTLSRVSNLSSPGDLKSAILTFLLPVAIRLGDVGCASPQAWEQQWTTIGQVAAQAFNSGNSESAYQPETLCLLKCVLAYHAQALFPYTTQLFVAMRRLLTDASLISQCKVVAPQVLEVLEAASVARGPVYIAWQPLIQSRVLGTVAGVDASPLFAARTERIKETIERIRVANRSWDVTVDWNSRLNDEFKQLAVNT